jgi:hypothetical protein
MSGPDQLRDTLGGKRWILVFPDADDDPAGGSKKVSGL